MLNNEREVWGSPGLRLLQLYILLSSTARPYTLTRLAGLFHCSRQTVLRMMEQLVRVRDANIETWVENRARYYRIVSSPTRSVLSFTPDTLRYVALCRDILRHLLPESVRLELQDVFGAAEDGLALNKERAAEPIAEPWVKGRIDYAPFQAVIEDIQTAMRERRLCRIDYRARSSGTRHRYLLAPSRIVVYREALYVRCRIYDAPGSPTHEYRTLAIHRILGLRLAKEKYSDASADDQDATFGFPFHNPIQVRARFWGSAAAYVEERIWSADQTLKRRRDGTLDLTFVATSGVEVISWILSFGPDAELMEPKELKEGLRGLVGRLGKIYGK